MSNRRPVCTTSRLRGPRAIWAMTMAMALAACGLAAGPLHGLAPLPEALATPWWVVAALFYLAESNVVHVHVGGDAHSFSLSEVALVVGLASLAPAQLLAAYLLGSALALTIHRRQSTLKLAFNLAQFGLNSMVAAWVFRAALGSSSMLGPQGWAAMATAVLTAAGSGLLIIESAIALMQGPQRGRLRGVAPLGLAAALANTAMGVMAVTIAALDPRATWMVGVPVVILLIAYRAYLSEREQRQSVQFLYAAARILQRSAAVQDALPALLRHTGDMFRAGVIEITLFPLGGGDAALRTTYRAGQPVETLRPVALDPTELMVASVAADGEGLLVNRPGRRRPIGRCLARRRVDDAMVAALEGEKGPIGIMLVGNRLGDVTTFTARDLKLLETLAQHIGVALENGELERSLAHLRDRETMLRQQAFYDPLTKLPNRTLFADRMEHAFSRRSAQPCGVLFIDLDGFKAVNDTLGHAAGDEVLVAVGERLRSCLRPSDTAARLGGDEFAVLLEPVGSAAAAVAVAERFVASLEVPIPLSGGQHANVGASVGVALGVPGDDTTADVVRNADLAMYRAKGRTAPAIELHDPALCCRSVDSGRADALAGVGRG